MHKAVLILLILCGAGCAESQRCGPTTPREALDYADAVAALIEGDLLRATVAELASDAYEGRGPGTEGDRKAREWIAARLAALGLAPGFDDGYQQTFRLISVATELPAEWLFSTGVSFAAGSEFVANVANQAASARLSDAELVFVGYGIQAPEHD